MSTEIVKRDAASAAITIGTGPISMEGLTLEQQNELKMLAAKKGIDLAAKAADMQLQNQAASAEVNAVLAAAKGFSDSGVGIKIESTTHTATGTISIKAKKGLIF